MCTTSAVTILAFSHASTMRLKALRNCASPQRWRMRLKLEWCGNCSCSSFRQRMAVDLSLAHQLVIVHDAGKQAGKHRPYRHFGLDRDGRSWRSNSP